MKHTFEEERVRGGGLKSFYGILQTLDLKEVKLREYHNRVLILSSSPGG